MNVSIPLSSKSYLENCGAWRTLGDLCPLPSPAFPPRPTLEPQERTNSLAFRYDEDRHAGMYICMYISHIRHMGYIEWYTVE